MVNDSVVHHDCPSEVGANHHEISRVAFQLWEKAGRPEGRDWEFWLAAETQLLAPRGREAVKAETVAARPPSAKTRVQPNPARPPVPRF